MNLTKTMMPIVIVTLATSALAYTIERELMTIELTDGTKQEINVADISSVKFVKTSETVAFELTPASGDPIKADAIAPMFRAVPEDDGGSTGFGFGAGTAESVAELTQQPYAVRLYISATSLYTGKLDLTDATKATITIFRYEDGAVAESWSEVREGSVTTSRDTKGTVTFELDATLTDGPSIYASFKGRVTDVETLDAMDPAPTYHNELLYFNADGIESYHDMITSVSARYSSSTKRTTFTFNFEKGYYDCSLEVNPEYFGEVINVATSPTNSVCFKYGYTMQLYSPNEQGRYIPKNATCLVKNNGDGTYTIEADFTNLYTYKSFTSSEFVSGGTPERVILEWTGEVSGTIQ